MNLFSNILNTSVKDRFLSGFTPTQDSNIFTGKTTSEKIASGEIKSRQLSPSENPFTQKKQGAVSDFLTNFDPNKSILTPIETGVRNISQNIQQGGQQLSDISMQHAQNVQNKGYRDEDKIKSTVAELLKQGFDQNTINTVIKNLDDQGKFQGSLTQNPISGTLASVESGLSKGLGTMFQGISNIGSAPLQDSGVAGVTRFAKGAMEAGLGSAQLATSAMPTTLGTKALVAPAVNTLFSTDTAGKVLQPISQGIETGIGMGQEALGFNSESSVSKDIQNIGSTAGTIALLGGAQKGAGKLYEGAKPIVSKAGEKISNIPNPITGAKNVITREIPVGIMERDLSLTPTERANIETINGKPAGAVALEYNLPKDKQAMADTLSVKADEAYNGITRDLKNITTRSESLPAKEMLGIMLDEMGNSPILVRTMKPYMEKLQSMMDQSDYSLSEKNAIRRDFDRIVANKIFDSKGRVSGIEDKAIANIREGLSSELQNEAMKYGVDIKGKNDILRTSISLRDGVLRRLSQENKNNKIGLQDIGVGAILGAGDPLTTASIIFGKKALEKSAPGIAQRLYNSNKTPYATSNLKRGVTITPHDTTNGLSIAPDNVPTVRIPVKTTVKKPIVKPNTIKNESKVSKPKPKSTSVDVSNKQQVSNLEKEYVAKMKKGNNLVIDSDKIKEQFSDYDQKNPTTVHEKSSELSKIYYKNALKDQSYKKVVLTAGGGGSGKSEILVSGIPQNSGTLVFDGTGKSYKKIVSQYDEAKKAGKDAEIKAVYIDYNKAKQFNAKRDRTVAEDILADTHKGYRKTLLQIAKERPDINISLDMNIGVRDKNGNAISRRIPRKNIVKFLEAHQELE